MVVAVGDEELGGCDGALHKQVLHCSSEWAVASVKGLPIHMCLCCRPFFLMLASL